MSQAEPRILAEMSQEPVWIQTFLNGWDKYAAEAAIFMKERWDSLTEEGCRFLSEKKKCSCEGHKDLRDVVKAVILALFYGQGSRALSETLDISQETAQAYMDAYVNSFPKGVAFLRELGMSAQQTLESRTLANRRRRWKKPTWDVALEKAKLELGVETPTPDQVRKVLKGLFASIDREGKNGPIQGTNADMMKRAMYLAWLKLEPQFGAHIVNMVHDELVVECPEENVEECYKFVSECMSNAGGEFVKSIPMPTEGHIEDCWTK
jgi:DNA polymerase-1